MTEYTTWRLANMAECSSPDRKDSAGAVFLRRVADAYEEAKSYADGELPDDDTIAEIADGAPSVYTATRWAEFVDLGAWQEDISELMPDAGSDMEGAAGVALYMIAERLCYALRAQDEANAAESEDTEG